MWPKYNCMHFGCETSLPRDHRLKETQVRQGSFWCSSFQQCCGLSFRPPEPSDLGLYALTRDSSIQTGHSKAMHQNILNWMRAFVVTSALGNEDVSTLCSPCNSKQTRIINFPHTHLYFWTVGGLGILFFDHDVIDDVTGQHPICILRNSTGGRRMWLFYFFVVRR